MPSQCIVPCCGKRCNINSNKRRLY